MSASDAFKRWRPLRAATARDMRRLRALRFGGSICGVLSKGGEWECSLGRTHRGRHEAWSTEPLELCKTWERR